MRKLLVILCIILSGKLQAQYFPVYSQYLLNGLAINPAYAGSRDVLSSSLYSRKQWLGFDGAPTTFTISAHTPLKNKKIGVGLHFINENIGLRNNYSFFANYAYRIRVGQGRLSFGLKGGIELFSENYNNIAKTTDYVFSGKISRTQPNFGFGAYYFTDHYFLGVSVPTFLSYKKEEGTDNYKAFNSVSNYNFLITGGKLIWFSNTFKLKPSFLIKYVTSTPVQYDLNLNTILFKNELLWLGVSYRSKEAIVGIVEVQMGSKWHLGLSYDHTIGNLSNYLSGSIEVMLRMELKTVVKTINPRFF